MANDEIIFGWHAVSAAMRYEPETIRGIWIEKGRDDKRARALLRKTGGQALTVQEEPKAALDRMTGGRHHQGIVAKCIRQSRILMEDALPGLISNCKGAPLFLALDEIQDPHNLGACLRTADAAGVTAVISPAHRAARLNATVRKVASGAAETVPFVQVVNLARALRKLKDEHAIQVVGTASEVTTPVYDLDLTRPTVVVAGSEERGLRRIIRELCDAIACIPMLGKVESLNVSVATGVFLFEAIRQRRGNTPGAQT